MTQKTRNNHFKDLFIAEEIKGEKLINRIRVSVAIFTVLFLYIRKGVFTGGSWSNAIIVSTVVAGIIIMYSVIQFFLFKNNFYHSAIKYVSVFLEMTIIAFNLFAYRIDDIQEASKIFYAARFSLFFVLMFFIIYRFSFFVGLFAGILSALGYYFLIIYQNPFTNMTFSFYDINQIPRMSRFDSSEEIAKVVVLIIAGITAGAISQSVKKLVIKSIQSEQDKAVFTAINKENRKYLDNIRDGLLLIDKQYIINDQFSRSLMEIFETKDTGRIANKNFIDFIYPGTEKNEELKKELQNYFDILFTNKNSSMSMLMDINPLINKEILIIDDHNKEHKKIISASFVRIFKNDEIENVMVILEDKTNIIQTQNELIKEKQKRKTEVELIAIILNIDPLSLAQFLTDTKNIYQKTKEQMKQLDQDNVINDLFRSMHSLKGVARTLGFMNIATVSHQLEDILVKVRDYKYKADDKNIMEKINSLLEELKKQWKIIINIQEKFTKHMKGHTIQINNNNQLDVFLKSLEQLVSHITRDTDKKIHLDIINQLTELPFLHRIKDSIIQLISNAVDHGIEEKYERITHEKNETGNIQVHLFKKNSDFIIEVQDDGKGLDFKKIKQKALERHLIKQETDNQDELLKQIFKPGFSSKDETTLNSGRGVGLDIVKDSINYLHGKIAVKTKTGLGTKFVLSIPEITNKNKHSRVTI